MYSFDVFDTVITRTTATPQGIFALMQQRIRCEKKYEVIPEFVRLNFYTMRCYAETLAHYEYMVGDVQEITLKQVYDAMACSGEPSEQNIAMLMELECQTELECVVPIEENIQRIKELLELGEKVVLISDMYLDKSVISGMLAKVDTVLAGLPLYLSSEWKKNKHRGGLFPLVREKEGIEYREWTHIGDNIHSDVEMPRSFGIQTEIFSFPQLTEKEQEAIESNGNDAFYQLTIGAARLSRLKREKGNAWEIGCTYSGAILYPYVEWLVQKSVEAGIKRLYFIARDGYILWKIAKIIIQERKLDIQTHYIYGSRKAWRMASVSEDTDIAELLRWSHERKILTTDELAKVFELELEEMKGFLPMPFLQHGFVLDIGRRLFCKKVLSGSREFKEFLICKHSEKRRSVVKYLMQEIDVSDNKFAFVELAGSGFTQECLARIMRDFCEGPITTFFYKRDRIEGNDKLCKNKVFFTGLINMHIIIEMLCRAPQGQTWGYKEKDGQWVPEMRDDEGERLEKLGYAQYVAGIEEFTRIFTRSRQSFFQNDSMRMDIAINYMTFLAQKPPEKVLNFLADMPNNETGREQYAAVYAPRLSLKDIVRLYLYRTDEPVEKFYRGTYLEYSLKRCSPREQRMIDFCKRHHDDYLGHLVQYGKKKRKNVKKRGHKYAVRKDMLFGRIVLYGAGKVGQDLHAQILEAPNVQLVCWIDREYEKYRAEGRKVDGIEEIDNLDFDVVFVAISKQDVAEGVRTVLRNAGVPLYKICIFSEIR